MAAISLGLNVLICVSSVYLLYILEEWLCRAVMNMMIVLLSAAIFLGQNSIYFPYIFIDVEILTYCFSCAVFKQRPNEPIRNIILTVYINEFIEMGPIWKKNNQWMCVIWFSWKILQTIMTSSNGNIFRVTGHLCGESPSTVNSPHKGQWRGALMYSSICVWINGWVIEIISYCYSPYYSALSIYRGHFSSKNPHAGPYNLPPMSTT